MAPFEKMQVQLEHLPSHFLLYDNLCPPQHNAILCEKYSKEDVSHNSPIQGKHIIVKVFVEVFSVTKMGNYFAKNP